MEFVPPAAQVFAPRDRPPSGRLYFVTEGTCLYDLRAVGPGETFGELDVVMDQPHLGGGQRHCFAVSYLHVHSMSREDFQAMQWEFPRICQSIRLWILWKAVKYHLKEQVRREAKPKLMNRVPLARKGRKSVCRKNLCMGEAEQRCYVQQTPPKAGTFSHV
eukprot:7008203-Prymnesium_polylepis.1